VKRLTVKEASRQVRAIGYTLRKTGHGAEIRVNKKGAPESMAYYTDDLKDAVLTAMHMSTPQQIPASAKNPAKLERCVKKVKQRKGNKRRKKIRSAYAVCKAAISGKTRKTHKNPAWYIHVQKHGRGPVLLFNGQGFSNQRAPLPFTSANAAMYKARHLLGKYQLLSQYKIWVSHQFYGAPTVNTRVNRARRNPESLDQAARKLEDFTGREATHVERAPARSKQKTGLVVGEMDRISYIVAREGIEGGRNTRFVHKFRKDSRPLLAVSTDGKQLHVVGGQYEFTDAGIEDRG
jgi:hypothetical protein